MAKEERFKRIVAHPRLFMAVKGKLEHIPKGSEVHLTQAQCDKFGAKVSDPSDVKVLAGGELVDADSAPSEVQAQLAAVTEERDTLKSQLEKVQGQLATTAGQLDAAKKKLAAAAAKK